MKIHTEINWNPQSRTFESLFACFLELMGVVFKPFKLCIDFSWPLREGSSITVQTVPVHPHSNSFDLVFINLRGDREPFFKKKVTVIDQTINKDEAIALQETLKMCSEVMNLSCQSSFAYLLLVAIYLYTLRIDDPSPMLANREMLEEYRQFTENILDDYHTRTVLFSISDLLNLWSQTDIMGTNSNSNRFLAFKEMRAEIMGGWDLSSPFDRPDGNERTKLKFPTPKETTWLDVKITFLGETNIKFSAKGITKEYTLKAIGLTDMRSKDRPNKVCNLLQLLAVKKELSWDSFSATTDIDAVKKQINRLRIWLKSFMSIADDPFEIFDRKTGWKPKFLITSQKISPLA